MQTLHALVHLVARMFAPQHSAQIRFLKAQLRILRRRIPADRIVPDPDEKAELLRLGAEFDHDIAEVLEIVQPRTYRRWLSDGRKGRQPKRSGRPRIGQDIRDLVVRMGKGNLLWGYRRIVGELTKLGHGSGATTVKRVLLENGIHPTPEKHLRRRPPMPWTQFIHAHMETLVACDFFTKPVYTLRGKFDAYCLVFIHLASRRVFCSPATFSPNEAWVMQQARNAAMWMEDIGIEPTRILMDRDTKFTLQFRHFWRSQGVEPKRLPFRAAQMNAFAETFIGKLKGECLNFFVIFSLAQLDHIMTTWLRHYHTERPHRGIGIGNRVLDPDFKPRTDGAVCCHRQLGGIITSYYREAA